MKWPDGKPYYSVNQYYRERFGGKTYKLSLDIGATCPNRDGTLSHSGCVFCSESGSGDHAIGLRKSMAKQIEEAIEKVSGKYNDQRFIAYLQSFTNTYGDTETLLDLYRSILKEDRILGLTIGTRPDCLEEFLLDGLAQLQLQKPIWIELGLQSIHHDSALKMNRCYSLAIFEDAYNRLQKRSIPVVIHLIAGLPWETDQKFLESVRYVSKLKPAGIKLHMLHVLKNTPLGQQYMQAPFTMLSQKDYCNLICEAIGLLPTSTVLHRITGDAPKDLLLAPIWTLDKRSVLNTIHRSLKERHMWQGKNQHQEADHDRQ